MSHTGLKAAFVACLALGLVDIVAVTFWLGPLAWPTEGESNGLKGIGSLKGSTQPRPQLSEQRQHETAHSKRRTGRPERLSQNGDRAPEKDFEKPKLKGKVAEFPNADKTPSGKALGPLSSTKGPSKEASPPITAKGTRGILSMVEKLRQRGCGAFPKGGGSKKTKCKKVAVVYYATAQDKLSSRAQKVLEKTLGRLEQTPNYILLVEGHTDSRGEEHFNSHLSSKRAEVVADYLVQRGVEKQRIAFRGLGSSQPWVRGNTPLAWAKNRRSMIWIIDEDL